jgi:hypothetical protein
MYVTVTSQVEHRLFRHETMVRPPVNSIPTVKERIDAAKRSDAAILYGVHFLALSTLADGRKMLSTLD